VNAVATLPGRLRATKMQPVTILRLCTFAGLLPLLAACGGSEPPPAPAPVEAPPAPARGISVKVQWAGDVEDAPVAVERVAECVTPAPSGRLVVGADRGLANVLVSVPDAAGVPGVPEEVSLTAAGCRFAPVARVVPPATPVRFVNEDSALHTFHIWRAGDGDDVHVQNVAVPPGASPARWVLDDPGRYRVTSDRHAHMEAWILVAPAGTAGVTDGDGRLELGDVAPGEHAVELFHSAAGTRTQTVTVPADGPAALHTELRAQPSAE